MMAYEYRVGWRWSKDPLQRRRLFQTEAGARGFAGFLEDPPDPLDRLLEDNVHMKGEPTDIVMERREVGEWERTE